jgi:hypothetical protein
MWQTSASSVPPILEEEDNRPIATTGNGMIWNPSRWGHLV